ncbi:hypothetical protein MMC18_001511 [Xylographa bjoerkii]|nr:hypothetical protein [Xylographa bjoerkii]
MSITHPTPTLLATAIHALLTHACAPPLPSPGYKARHFVHSITRSVPVLACLAHLATSAHTTPGERATFALTHTRLAFLLAQEAAGVPISSTQLLLNALLLDDLAALFAADRRAHAEDATMVADPTVFPHPSTHPSAPTDSDGNDADTVSLLLHLTTSALQSACTAFKGGVLRTRLSGPKQLLVALEALSRDARLAVDERAVFARAKAEVGKLWALQRAGVREVLVAGGMWVQHWAWWRLVVGVLERDAGERGQGGRWAGYGGGWVEGEGGGEDEEGGGSFAKALAGGEWPVREEGGSVDGGSGSGGSKRGSGTGSLGASFRKKLRGAFA